jgi:hypothetical protein
MEHIDRLMVGVLIGACGLAIGVAAWLCSRTLEADRRPRQSETHPRAGPAEPVDALVIRHLRGGQRNGTDG